MPATALCTPLRVGAVSAGDVPFRAEPPTAQSIASQSFGAIADDYDRYRPTPPRAAVDWMLPPGASSVLDVGAGTGAMTRVLVERVAGRVAVAEPDPRMIAVLARRCPSTLPVSSVAEMLPFAAGSFDAVIVSSAWHWMDPALAVPEIGRVLVPGGRLGVAWNGPARDVDWVAELLEVSEGSAGCSRRQSGADKDVHRLELPPGTGFSSPETAVFSWSSVVTRDDLVGLAGTYSAVITLPAHERAELLYGFERRVGAHRAFGEGSTVELPMECWCWRTTLRDGAREWA